MRHQEAPLAAAELPVPEPETGEIRIKVCACDVCHTELDEIEGRAAPPRLPVVPGHEVVGRVEKLGTDAGRFNIGERLGVGWIHSSSGTADENLSSRFRATGRDVNGGYAEYMTVPETYAYPIPDLFSDAEAAPLLCAGRLPLTETRRDRGRSDLRADRVEIGEGADLTYQEADYHGASGGIEVTLRASIRLGPRARYLADFSLVQGRVGRLDIDYEVDVGAEAVAELTSKVYGHGNDHIRIREVVRLNGERTHGLIRSRVAADGEAFAEVLGATEGNAAYARGHVDCLEIVREPPPHLIALGMTRYWCAANGLRLDTAPFVVALQHATGIEPVVLGKPARPFFAAALAALGTEAAETIMIGDDIRGDIGGAQNAGIRGLLVRTGKFRPQDLQGAIQPDGVIDSIADLPAWWAENAILS